MIIRPATEADLPAVYQVWYLNETRGETNPPPPRAYDSNFAWELQTGQTKPIPETDLAVTPADTEDPELAAWDRQSCGRDRALDRQHWVETSGAIPLWIERAGQRIGYAYVHRRSPGALWNPDAPTVGPIGARDLDDAVYATLAVIRWVMADYQPAKLRMLIPGPHPALSSLLSVGFHITYVETYCSSRDEPIYDPMRYVCAGEWM